MPNGRARSASNLFQSEENWPQVLYSDELSRCLEFLSTPTAKERRLLRLHGPSGTGKSLFGKQLVISLSRNNPTATAVYVDVPAADLEASSILANIGSVLDRPREAKLSKPHSVPKKVSESWRSDDKTSVWRGSGYLYRVSRDLVAQIPAAGPFIKAVMPSSNPVELLGSSSAATPLAFLNGIAAKSPVLLVVDNYQNLSPVLRDTIEASFQDAGQEFRLVAVERKEEWQQSCLPKDLEDFLEEELEFLPASLKDIQAIISAVLPNWATPEGFSETLFRRSEGNLKSVWFQLKLFVERAKLNGMLQSDDSYENVITSLSSLDQTILRTIVFLLGGLSISEITALLGSLNSDLLDRDVARSIADMATIGLLIVNGATRDRVRVEHDMVSKVVDNLTPEDDKLELRQSLVSALVDILNNRKSGDDDDALFDRLIGITHEQEVRQTPAIQSHLVRHINRQHELEQYMYVATLCRDSVCWQVLDILPSATVALVLDALQKCSLFSLGLITTERLKSHENHASLAWLYEGKYLAQLFKYEEALASLQKAEPSSERELVEYTIRLNLHENKELKKLAEVKLKRVESGRYVEFDLFVLRNSGHLFSRSKARQLLELAVTEFDKKKLSYAAATARNNLGIIELDDGNLVEAQALFDQSFRTLEDLGSPERYQPQVNLGGVAILRSDWDRALTMLSNARDSLPPSLPMDQLMLSHNEAAVLFLSGGLPEVDTIPVFSEVSQLASRTRDVRFIEVLSWFVQRLQCLQQGLPEPKVSKVLGEILSLRTARQELFMEFSFLGEKIDVPYILSPHWRH